MTEGQILGLKHDDLARCLTARSSLLKALHQTTVAFLKINNPEFRDDGLASFLEANNILKGRFFDTSTLPSSEYLNARPVDPYQKSSELHKPTEDGPQGRQEHLQEVANDANGTGGLAGEPRSIHTLSQDPNLSKTSEEESEIRVPAVQAPPGSDTYEGGLVGKSQNVSNPAGFEVYHEAVEEPSIHPSDALPLSSDDVNSMNLSIVEESASEQTSANARPIHLPPKEAQESRLEHLDKERSNAEKNGLANVDEDTGSRNINRLTPPASGGDVTPPQSTGQTQRGDGYPGPDGILKSQIDISRIDALAGAPSTPDEQLRLEEAQSMRISQAQLSPYGTSGNEKREAPLTPHQLNTSSQFINDNMADGDTTTVISNVNDQVGAKQDGSPDGDLTEQENAMARPTSGLRHYTFPGMNGESSKDLTLSRRPPMRIDTRVLSFSDTSTSVAGNRPTATTTSNIHGISGAPTPSKPAPPTAIAQSPPERMTTRVSSGALRHKSVSEILGETPKSTPIQAERVPLDRVLPSSQKEDAGSLQTPKSASSFTSPDPAAFKQRLSELREKEKSKLSTVVFSSSRNSEVANIQRSDENETPIEDRDYLLTLFAHQVLGPPRSEPLIEFLKKANKTLTTNDHYTNFDEWQACKVLKRVQEMQNTHRWSLRQLERSVEPQRPVTHWDVLLSQMKWMRTDFREERRWKLAAAKWTADACADWVSSSSEERKFLQVKARSVSVRAKSRSVSESTPELVHTTDDEASEATDDDFNRGDGSHENPPAAIFSLAPDMFVFGLNRSPVAEKLLLELPLYQPSTDIQNAALRVTDIASDAAWKKPLVPVSKYAQGKIVSIEEGPPRKRSRFNYQDIDGPRSDRDSEYGAAVEPEQDNVALFDPENKHIRDRIHAGHAFRPPSEQPMPLQSFFECRQSSQWTQGEDDQLRRLVRDYSYNWSLISSCLSSPSIFSSGAERRTPWECFERWISLEGLPAEMAKINYFRAYHSRLSAAQKNYEAQQQAIQQQQGNNANHVSLRRRSTQPYTVERRKNAKHLHLIDAMRKLAKKRETQIQKQHHVASMAAMRKANEAVKPRTTMHTPQEFSRIKYERHLKMEEQAHEYRQRLAQQQKTAQQVKANQPSSQQSNGIQPVRNTLPGVPNDKSHNMTSTFPNGQPRGGDPSRQLPQMQRFTNGQTNGVLPNNGQGVPHAPMQPHVQMQMPQQRMPPNMASDNSMRVYHAASRVQAEQAAYQQQQRQQRHPQSNGQAVSPNMQNHSLLSQNNPAALASLQGRSSPSINGLPGPNGASTSPRNSQPQALSSGMTPAINQITAQFQQRHPQASQEQISRLTTDHLFKMSQDASQHAMRAAAGNMNANAVASNSNMGLQAPSPMQQPAAMMVNGGGQAMNSQQYAQLMRMQQSSQQRGAGTGGGQGMNGSRSVTPMIQRTGSGQGGPRPSQSPSARQVGMAGGQ